MTLDELARAVVDLVSKQGRYLAVVDASDRGLIRLRPRDKVDGVELDVSLHNDLAVINSGEMTLEGVLERIRKATLVSQADILKLIEIEPRKLVALVRHEGYLRSGSDRAKIDAMARLQAGPGGGTSICAYDRLSGDMCVVLALESENGFNTSIATQLKESGMSYEEARAIAIKNTMLRYSSISLLKSHPSANMIIVYERPAGYPEDVPSDCSTSVMLHKKYLKKLLKEFKGGIALAVPDRHTLLVTDAGREANVRELRQFAADWRKSYPHRQSTMIHVWRGEAWVVAG